MDPSNAAACRIPEGKGHENARCGVLLDHRGHCSARKNAATARSRTSTGHPIEVAFWHQPPPALSQLSVHCPDLQLPPDDMCLVPKIIAANDGLILFRVPVDSMGKDFYNHNDYFVYRAHHRDPKLDLLPNPWPRCFGDDHIAILSCGDNQYVVAALKIWPISEFTFTLHLYRSEPGGKIGSWTIQEVTVEEPLRDRVCPVPDSAERLMYHLTTKVITLGGPKGTVAWVDVWRGMLLCDVLEKDPKLRDMPLPMPAKGNWRRYLRADERYFRDITVSQHKDSIKYVEMEIIQPRVVTTTIPSNDPDPDSYLEWVRRKDCAPQLMYSLVPGSWKATTWSLPIPVTTWDDWRVECTADLCEFHVDNPLHLELLHAFLSSGGGDKETSTTLSLGCLRMGYPAFSVDDDVVYLLAKDASSGKMGLLIGFDVRKKELRGVAILDSERYIFRVCYLACGISKLLETATRVTQAEHAEAAE